MTAYKTFYDFEYKPHKRVSFRLENEYIDYIESLCFQMNIPPEQFYRTATALLLLILENNPEIKSILVNNVGAKIPLLKTQLYNVLRGKRL